MNILRVAAEGVRQRLQQTTAALALMWLAGTLQTGFAADLYWDADEAPTGNAEDGTNLGGAGIWDAVTANWWLPGTGMVAWPGTSADLAFFTHAYAAGVPAFHAVALSSGFTTNGLRFVRSGYTLSGGELTLAGASPTLFAGLGNSAIITSQIHGSDGLTVAGGGAIRLTANTNDYTGTTLISNGSLIITGQGALGASTSDIVVTGFNPVPLATGLRGFGGGSLVLDGSTGDVTISRNLSLQGQGPVADRGAALVSTGSNTLSGTVDMGASYMATNLSTRMIAADGTLNLTGTLNVLGAAGTSISSLGGTNQAGASFYNLSGTLAGSGTLEKSGGGTLYLNPSDSSGFSGVIRVSGSAASGQSVVRIDSPNVLGTRTSTGTSGVIDMNGGVLAVLMDMPSVQAGGVNANVYGRDGSNFFVDHTPNSSVKNQTVAFGGFVFEDNETFTFNGRNGYGISFFSATVNGGDNGTTLTNNLQGGALLSITGNFWNNTNNTGSRTLTLSGNGDTRITGNVLAAAAAFDHNLVKSGSGTLTITSAGGTLDGSVSVQGGTLAINDWRAINMHAATSTNTGLINIGSGGTGATLSIVGNNVALANLTTNKVINLAGTTGGAILLANQTGTSPGVVFNGDFTGTGGTSTNNKTLTLGGTNTAANTINGVIPNNNAGGLVSLSKVDTGTWVLGGTNTYTGATTISNGILKLQANGASSTVLHDSSAIVINSVNVFAGGTLEFVGQPSVNNVENLGVLTPSNGSGTVKLTAGSGGTASLVFASLGTVASGGTVNFDAPASSGTVSFASTSISNNIASAGLYFNGADFAFVPGANLAIRAPVYGDGLGGLGSDVDFVTSATALTGGLSNEITGSFSQGAVTIDSLRMAGDQNLTLTGLLTVRTAGASNATGGILQAGGSGTISGTGVTTGGSGALVINVDGGANSLTLDAPMTSTTTGGFTKVGAGTLRLGATNAQTGTISINEGTVRLAGADRLGAAASLTIRQGGVLELNGVTPATNTNSYNNNGIIRNSSATTDATFTVGGSNGTGTSYGIIEDGGAGKISVVKLGTGAQSWLGLSTYTGGTTIGSTGIVTINNLQDGGMASGIGASSNDASNLVFNGTSTTQAYGGLSYNGSTNDYTDRLFTFNGGANGGARIQSNGTNGATSSWTNTGALAFGSNATGNAQGLVLGGSSSGDNRFFPIINDNGAAATSVYKADAGVWYLEAANGYSGVTELRGGALYVQDGSSLPTASNLVFNAGIVASTGTLTRSIGTGASQMRFAVPAANTALFRGGFAAGGSKLTVDWGAGNVWGSTADFLDDRDGLIFGAANGQTSVAKADVELISDFSLGTASGAGYGPGLSIGITQNSANVTVGSTAGLVVGQSLSGTNVPTGAYIVSINSATQFTMSASAPNTSGTTGTYTDGQIYANALRPIRVDDNSSIGADFATLSGVISGNAGTGIRKLGSGILVLSGNNTYDGETSVYQGTLVVSTLGNSASPGATSVGISTNGATNAAAITLGNGGTSGGILEYVGLGEVSDRKIRLNSTTGSNQIHADGVGALILTNVANDMVDGAKTLFLRGVNAAGNMVTSPLEDKGGTLGVTVDGSAMWILTNSANSFTGSTAVSAGALGIGDDAALGGSTLVLGSGSIFAYGGDRTVTNAVQGANNTGTGMMGDYSLAFTNPLQILAAANNYSLANNLVDGKTLTFAGATADSLPSNANRTFTVDGSGTTIIDGNVTTTQTGAGGLALTKTGDGVLVFGGAGGGANNFNRNNATVDIDRGTLRLAASEVIGHGVDTQSSPVAYGSVTMSPELAAGDTATLDLNGQSETINGLTANSDGTAIIDNSAATAASLTFGANNSAVSFGGGIGTYTITDSGAGALSIFKTGTADVTIPTGVTLSYQGTTGVTQGNFTISSPVNGTSALSVVNSGSTLALRGGITNPSAITSIVVEDGGTLSLLDGAGNKLDSLTSLQLGSSGGSMTTLNLNVGDNGTAGDELNTDLLTLLPAGSLSLFSGNQVTFNLTDAGLSGNQSYDLLSFVDGGLTTGALGIGDWVLGATPGGFDSVTLSVTDTLIRLQTGNLITGDLYWRGLTDNTWNADVNNWSTDKAGTTPGSTIPGAGTDVIFAYNGASGALSTTLEQNFKVNSLTFESGTSTPASVTIDPGSVATNRIEVAPQVATDGIQVLAGGPAAVTLSGPLKLGANQTWYVADASSTLSLGSLQGEADVTITGAGKVTLTAASEPTFNGGVTSDFSVTGATLEILNAAALGNTVNSNLATISVGSGGAFFYNGAVNSASTGVANNLTLAGGTLSAGGNAGNNYYTGSVAVTADSIINMRGSNSAVLTATQGNVVLSGPVSGSGKLTVDSINTVSGGNQSTGTLYFQGDNSAWSGGINLLRGSIQSQTTTGLGTGAVTASAGRIQFVTAGGTTHTLNQNITVDAPGGILELYADASGTPVSDMTVNLNGTITIGSAANANNALRFTQASDDFSAFNITGPVVLGNHASIGHQGSAGRALVIPTVISDGGSGYSLAINDEQGGWGVTSRTVRLTGANTFSGDLSLTEGTLEFNTVSNIGGAASALGQGSAITLAGATLSFIGDSNQSTNRPITNNAGSPTLAANGTSGASITYAGAIAQAANLSLTLTGTGTGVISGGITQAAGSADINVNSGDWTFDTGAVNITDDFLINGGSMTLQNMELTVNDDIVNTAGTLNLNSAGVWKPVTASGTSSGLYARGGGVINLGANDVNGADNGNGADFIFLADGTTAGTGTLNTNGFSLSIPQFNVGAIADGYTGLVTGNGTIGVTYSGTDWGSGIRLYRGSVESNLAGVASILKQGLGDVTLSGDNSGLTGTVAATRLDSGNLILDFSTNNSVKISEAAGLDMRGGMLTVNGNGSAATSVNVSSFTLGSGGGSAIQVNAGTGQEAALNLGAITRGNGSQDGTIRFYLPGGTQSTTNGVTTTSPNSTFGLLGTGTSAAGASAYATVDDGNGVWFATSVSNGTNNNVVALVSSMKDDVSTWLAGDHVTDSSGFTGGPLTCTSINSLRFDAFSGSDLIIASGSSLNIASGGILVTSYVGGTPSITGGTLVSGTQELVIHQDSSQPFEIGSVLRGGYGLTKTGAGTLLLSGNNVYTDETEIQEGILRIGGGNAIGDTSLVTLADDHSSALELLADETIGRLQGGSASSGMNSLALVDIGSHTLTINYTGTSNTVFAGLFAGTGHIVKSGSHNMQLTNVSNGFTGIVTVDGGLLFLSGLGQINASIIRVNKGGAFMIDNNGTTRSSTRILDTTPITLDSADGTFNGNTIVRGVMIRTDQNATTNETIGDLNFNSGASYLSGDGDVSSGTAVTFLIANDFVRFNNATFNARGRALGAGSGERNQFKIGTPANETAFIATLVGGGGAAASKNISIIPWAIGGVNTGTNGALTDNDMGNSLLTYVAGAGVRPLDHSTEYNTFTAAGTENVRESLSADLTGLSGKTVNALVIDNAATAGLDVAGSGSGQSLAVTSGAMLFTVSGGAASTAYDTTLGGFDDGITVGGTNEYVIHVVNPSSAATTSTLTATIASPLISAADITKSGRGTLILSGVNTAGGGSNKTTLNEGTLEIADLDNIGGNTGALVFAGGTLRLGATLGDDISQRTITFLQGGATIDTNGGDFTIANSVGSGIGGLTKTGAGNLTLNGTASYTGATIVSAGTLTAGANDATGNGGDLTILGGSTLDVGASSLSHKLVTFSGADPVLAGTGTLAATTGFFFDHDGGSDLVTVDAVLAGAGGLLKANRGSNLTLNGLNTFTGPLEVYQGTLNFGSIANVGGGASALGAPTSVENGTIRLGFTTGATTLNYTGTGHTTDRVIELQGTTGAVTINSNGTGALGLGTIKGANAGTKTLTLDGNSTGFDNTVALIEECVATLNLAKTGSSTWLLTGTNAFSGSTTIDNGILKLGVSDSLPATTALRIGNSTTAGTLDLNGFDQTVGSLESRTNSSSVTNQILISSGNTLTVNGAVTLGANADNSSTLVTATGGGALIVNSGGANFQVGGASGATNDNKATVDFSGLSSFTANLGTGTFRLGDGNSGTETNASTLKLATNNTITAASVRIGDGSGGNVTHTLTLGSGANLIQADTINVGSAGTGIRSNGALLFDALDTTGTITLRASDGLNRTTLNLVNTTGSTANHISSTIDFTGHTADVLAGTLTTAQRNTGTGAASAILSFNQGSLDVTTLNMASRSGTGTGNADATLNLGGGTATIGALNLAVNTSSGGTVTADVNVTGGNVTLGPVNMANAGTGRTVTATIDLTGGTVEVTGDITRTGGAGTENATLTLDGAILDMNSKSIGSAGSTVTFNAQSGTLQNLAELNGGGTLTKSTAGTLILDTANGYTGGTTVTSGTLLANNTAGSATGTGIVTVNGGTLGGSGTIAGATTIYSGASLTAGTAGGVESLAFGGDLTTVAGSTWLVDFVSGLADFVDVQSGALSLGGGINIVDDGSWVPYQSYQIASYSSLTGSFSNALTSGIQVGNFFIDYGSGTSDFITLTAVPEPETWVPALLVLILGLGLHRRRRR